MAALLAGTESHAYLLPLAAGSWPGSSPKRATMARPMANSMTTLVIAGLELSQKKVIRAPNRKPP